MYKATEAYIGIFNTTTFQFDYFYEFGGGSYDLQAADVTSSNFMYVGGRYITGNEAILFKSYFKNADLFSDSRNNTTPVVLSTAYLVSTSTDVDLTATTPAMLYETAFTTDVTT